MVAPDEVRRSIKPMVAIPFSSLGTDTRRVSGQTTSLGRLGTKGGHRREGGHEETRADLAFFGSRATRHSSSPASKIILGSSSGSYVAQQGCSNANIRNPAELPAGGVVLRWDPRGRREGPIICEFWPFRKAHGSGQLLPYLRTRKHAAKRGQRARRQNHHPAPARLPPAALCCEKPHVDALCRRSWPAS